MIVLWREDILVTPPSVATDSSEHSLGNRGGMLGIAAKRLYPGFHVARTGYPPPDRQTHFFSVFFSSSFFR